MRPCQGSGVRITHLGHSCLLVEAGDARILIDPGVFSHGFEELTGLDAVVVTHQHPDHLDGERLPPLLDANDAARLLTEPELAAELGRVGLDASPLHPQAQERAGGVTLTGVGGRHAVIHPEIPRIGNVGVLFAADGEPTLFHPGDAYEYVPSGVDLLALPLSAPWTRLSETVTFARAVAAARIVPIHDGTVSAPGRGMYLGHVGRLVPGSEVVDLAGAGPATL